MTKSSESTVERFVRQLQSRSRTARSVHAVHRIPAKDAQFGEFHESITPTVREALGRRGMRQPWSHQGEAWRALGEGQNLVVVTPTASGKTLCYQVPIASMLDADDEGCALLLYPTKALAQDQAAEFNELLSSADIDEIAHVYDGDTPNDIRRKVRQSARLVLTNPDMLHQAMLPNHNQWRRVLSSLRYVVIDEMHTYRGVFGSHVANVLRRLQRLCRYYGSNPRFVLTSATIANPAELGEALTGRNMHAITESGAPQGEKLLVFYNPPIVNAELKRRQSAPAAARRLARELLEDEHSCIIFCRSRQSVEIVTRSLQRTLEDRGKRGLARRISGYRGGYLPEERRQVERALRAGEIRCVVSTNALELGVDIGALDACIIAGYPGTIASSWQQAGRAGRRQQTAVAILIASDEAVDQYIVQNPQFFIDASPEHGRIDPDNLRVLVDHIKCALFELPLDYEEPFASDLALTQDICAWLAEEAQSVTPGPRGWHWASENFPATMVSIRDIPDENFVIIDTGPAQPSVLGEIDFVSAHKTVYEKAIYQHGGKLFEVHRLDYEDRKAWVRPVNPDYYTQAIDQTRVFVLDEFDEVRSPAPPHGWGEVRVATRFVGYKKIRHQTGENIGYGEILLPDYERHTTAYWVTFPAAQLDALKLGDRALEGGIIGIARALHTVSIVHLMCDASDILQVIGSRDGGAWLSESDRAMMTQLGQPVPIDQGTVFEEPTIFLYDRFPGGVGFSEKLFGLHSTLIERAATLIASCACAEGCPACVGPPEEIGTGGKAAALAILKGAGDVSHFSAS